MLRKRVDLRPQRRENIRGGHGRALQWDYLADGEMTGVAAVSVLVLEPGTSIAEHRHEGSEELYFVLEGSGTGLLDGVAFAVEPGDAWVVRDGHTHGLVNADEAPLSFLAVLTRSSRD